MSATASGTARTGEEGGATGGADARQSIQAIEGLIERLEHATDPEGRGNAQQLVRAVLDLHGAGLTRMMDLARGAREGGAALVDAFGSDDLVGSLLVLHGLHPASLDARVQSALRRVAPTGWALELLGDAGGVLQIGAVRTGDPRRVASADRVRALVEEAVDRAAPDAEGLEFVGDVEEVASQPQAFVSVEQLRSRIARPAGGDR
jgi:hypothetical protein